jgi:hypothetical protein
MPDFFDPTAENQVIVLVDAATLREAERLIDSCEHCDPVDADIPFDWILDRVTGSDPKVTDYILEDRRIVRNVGGRFWKRRWSSPLANKPCSLWERLYAQMPMS